MDNDRWQGDFRNFDKALNGIIFIRIFFSGWSVHPNKLFYNKKGSFYAYLYILQASRTNCVTRKVHSFRVPELIFSSTSNFSRFCQRTELYRLSLKQPLKLTKISHSQTARNFLMLFILYSVLYESAQYLGLNYS
jgi:hypothetical protein